VSGCEINAILSLSQFVSWISSIRAQMNFAEGTWPTVGSSPKHHARRRRLSSVTTGMMTQKAETLGWWWANLQARVEKLRTLSRNYFAKDTTPRYSRSIELLALPSTTSASPNGTGSRRTLSRKTHTRRIGCESHSDEIGHTNGQDSDASYSFG